MKSVRILESCLVNGQHAEAGSILRGLSPGMVADLMANGRAIIAPEPEIITTRDPVIETRDPSPAKKTRSK